ncbi:WD repeat-containing protein [Plectosphaerella plurivora]|uniref:WD repeat-containing protein JIP5 n=1 Tax=Plectosphaerella plurivora TaxID=936078 RepID=A0A9P8V314_9PEZI|nr:WD repeat-containing protein [Plectosphaerella plurivora]
MFENLCTLPLSAEVFATALHPTEPLLTVGLSSGHVQTFSLPPVATNSKRRGAAENGKGMIATLWQTKRHRGSCRTLAYNLDGSALYSAGTDALIKQFSPHDGRVISKATVPLRAGVPDEPCVLHVLNPESLLLGCDSGALHLYEIKDGKLSDIPVRTHYPHDDYVSSIIPLPPTEESTSGFSKQWISTGGTMLAASDWYKGVGTQSDDQEDELLCAAFIPGIGPKKNRKNGMVAVGSGSGVVTLWDKGVWDDQQERIIVDHARRGGESIDAMVLAPASLGLGKKLVVAVGDGSLRVVDVVRRTVDSQPGSLMRHDDTEGAISVAFDCHNRLISAGGRIVKVWQELSELQGNESSEDEDEGEEGEGENEEDSDEATGTKRAAGSDDEDEDDSDDDSDDSDAPKQKKKRKLNKPKKPSEFSFPGL